MRTLLLAALLTACTARADTTPTPTTSSATTPVTTPQPTVAAPPRLSAEFDTALLCSNILETGKRLGDPTFGMTESDPPAPSTVRGVTYRFGGEDRLVVHGMHADLSALGGITLRGRAIPAAATLEEIASMRIDGCGALQINEGANAIECRVGDVQVTLAQGSIGAAPIVVSALSDACR